MTKQDLKVVGRPVGRGNPSPENLLLGAKLGWMSKGACLGHDPDKWFSEEFETEIVEEAKAVCKGCPVKLECLLFATTPETEQLFGVWGGMSESERTPHQIKRVMRRMERQREREQD